MKTYSVSKTAYYRTLTRTEEQYEIYEDDTNDSKQSRTVAIFADWLEAQEYADKKNYVEDVVKEALA